MLEFINKFYKFISLEKERGYDNRAVVGGFEKIISLWHDECVKNNIDSEFLDSVSNQLSTYSNKSTEDRKKTLELLLGILEKISPFNPQLKNESISNNKTSLNDQNAGEKIESVNRKGLNALLTVIRGVGEETAKTFHKLKLDTINDLLHYYPRRYDDFSKLKPINRINYGEELSVIALVKNIRIREVRKGQFKITEAMVSDGTGTLKVTWFNQPWIANNLTEGRQIVLSGKVDMYLGHLVMTNPDWEPLEYEQLHTNRIVPIYSLTSGITQKSLRRMIYQVVNHWSSRIEDYLPQSIKKEEDLINLSTAICQIHFPDNMALLEKARQRLSFDEIFILQLGVLSQKRDWEANEAEKFEIDDIALQSQIEALPFRLTPSQINSLSEIRTDLASGKQMNRLLQGDVGSGKTVVARFAIEIIARIGAQSAFMAPTSILAEQHYRNIVKMFTNGFESTSPINKNEIALLIGDTPDKEKDIIRSNLANGSIKIIVGTHALIEEPIEYKWLQLAIIDEQHRFGVTQRAALRLKGKNPHLLVMSATPIPRSLALTIYGDLDLSVINEMPIGRVPIETYVLHPAERERAYQIIRNQIKKGHQAFIIYPLIESEMEEIRRAATSEYDRIKQEIFPQFKIGLMHGRLKQDEKDKIMQEFRGKELDILISTSVIEVGLDIPNATVVLIESANRFGLAQLHQIRGRVGRGREQSYCLLIPDVEDNLENERLAVMTQTNDGFRLAEFDLKQRGPGEFLGTRQSGYLGLKLATLTDLDLIERSRKQAKKLFDKDPSLSDRANHALLQEMRNYWPNLINEVS